jgi:hypothetical protein
VQNTLSQSISIRGRRVIAAAAGAGYARLREVERFWGFQICRRSNEKLRDFPRGVFWPGRSFRLKPVGTKTTWARPIKKAGDENLHGGLYLKFLYIYFALIFEK